MPTWKHYHIPQNLQDALDALGSADAPARLIAGGTDLLLDIQQGRQPPADTLVDVTAIPELSCLEERDGGLFIGAGVPLSRVTASPLVARHAAALAEAAALIGGPQVRNTATLGGNVAHALPAADGTIALAALDARAEIASREGPRRVPLLELFRGPGKSALDPCREILVGFHLPLAGPGEASAFARVMRPQGVALPVLNLAAWLRREGDYIRDVRIAIGPSGPTPQRAREAEAALRGGPLDAGTRARALEEILTHLQFRTSPHRATSEYRRHLCGVLLEEVLARVWLRAGSPVASYQEAG